MSVQTNQYLMYGAKFDSYNAFTNMLAEKYGEDKAEELIEEYGSDSAYDTEIGGKDGIFFLMNGMSGKYVVVGHVYAKGSDDDPFVADGVLEVGKVDPNMALQVANKISQLLGQTPELSTYLITHYR